MEVRMISILAVACGDLCSCLAVVVSFGALVFAILALIVAKKQLTENVNAVKTANSLEILSWFDDAEIRETLQKIYNENQNVNTDENVEGIYSLLFILDTACSLIASGNYDKELLYQLHEDFEQINRNLRVNSVLSGSESRFKQLDFHLLINATQPQDRTNKRNNTKSPT